MGRESLIVDTAKRSYGLEQVPTPAVASTPVGSVGLHHRLTVHSICLMQIVQAVDGAVVSLRGQLEALTILDETALTWPGLSLV